MMRPMMKSIPPLTAKVLGVLAVLLLAAVDLQAQCAMCKAVAQDAVNHQSFGVAVGLNAGIIFLMAIPYILLAVFIYAFFRKRISGFFRSIHQIHS